MAFYATTTLDAAEQRQVQWQLKMIAAPPKPAESLAPRPATSRAPAAYTGPRRLSPLEAARLRKRLTETISASDLPDTFRQVLWAVEEGALRRFDAAKALNIALKKLREGAWTRPNRMPPNWQRAGTAAITLRAAPPETCSAA